MKKILIFILLMAGIAAIPLSVSAENASVVLPTYKCIINDSDIYYKDSQYPLLSYKDITYFPMTWNYCRAMDLDVQWVDGEGLYIASKPTLDKPEFQVYPLENKTVNKSNMTAVRVEYPVFIDGKTAYRDPTYPLLNFRGITYFPMTWTYAHDTFGWNLCFENRVFNVDTLPDSITYITAKADENGIKYEKNKDGKTDNTMYYLDYATGNTTSKQVTDEEKKQALISDETEADVISDRISLKGYDICLDGKKLAEFKAVKDGTAAGADTEIYGSEKTVNGVTCLLIRAYHSLEIPAPYTPAEVYLYIKNGTEYELIAEGEELRNTGKAGNYTYIETAKLSGYRNTVFNYSILYRIDESGKPVCLNAEKTFENYKSISLIGISGGKAYLKCLWCPESGTVSMFSGEEYMSVSPVNDGFFVYDGSSLKQIHKYVFSNLAFVNSKGEIYIANNYRGTLSKL